MATEVTTLNEYQTESNRTARMDLPERERLATFALGLGGESGEVQDLIKKHLGHGHPLDLDKVKKELGDVLWYVSALAGALGFTLEAVARENVAKLAKRYPQGFNTQDSLNRVESRGVWPGSRPTTAEGLVNVAEVGPRHAPMIEDPQVVDLVKNSPKLDAILFLRVRYGLSLQQAVSAFETIEVLNSGNYSAFDANGSPVTEPVPLPACDWRDDGIRWKCQTCGGSEPFGANKREPSKCKRVIP